MRKILFSLMAATGLLYAGGGTAWAEDQVVTYKVSADDLVTDANGATSYSHKTDDIDFILSEATTSWATEATDITVGEETFSMSVGAQNEDNPDPNGGQIPTKGSARFVIKHNGTLTVVVSKLNSVDKSLWIVDVDNNKTSAEEGYIVTTTTATFTNEVKDNAENIITGFTSGDNTQAFSGQYSGGITFSVKENHTYYLYMDVSKIKYAGYIYTIYDETVRTPTYTTVYDADIQKWIVTLSCDTEGSTIYYKVAGDASYTEYTSSIKVALSKDVTVYAQKDDKTSEEVTFKTGSQPRVAQPSITYKALPEARTYLVYIDNNVEGCTYYYDFVVGNKANNDWTEYVKPLKYPAGTRIRAKAKKSGYKESNATSATTLPAFQAAGKSYTETTTAGSNKEDLTGICYTIAGAQVAGTGAALGETLGVITFEADFSNYVKLRTTGANNPNGNNTVVIDVTDQYTISKIEIRGHSNNNDNELNIIGVTVDGESLANVTEANPIVLPKRTEYSTTEEIRATLSDFSATKSIVLTFSGATQGILQFKFTYTLNEQPIYKTRTINEVTGYSTFYLDEDVIIPDNVTAYTGKVNGNVLEMTALEGNIPAHTGVILVGTEGETANFYLSQIYPEAAESDIEGVLADSTVEALSVYTLGYFEGKEDVGFYKYSGTTLHANTGFLPGDIAKNISSVRMTFDIDEPGNVTGISSVAIENQSSKIMYDLRGRKVTNLNRPGLYIVNGKKILVK